MSERRNSNEVKPVIDQLTAVIVEAGREHQPTANYHYIGFTKQELPAVTNDFDQLSKEAQTSVTSHKMTRLPFKSSLYKDIQPIKFISLDGTVHYEPEDDLIPEDLVIMTVLDGKGATIQKTFSETAILKGIAATPDTIWQDRLAQSQPGNPQRMLTTFIPSETADNSAYALLFKPAEDVSNEYIFTDFTKGVLKKLLDLEEFQKNQQLHRGYYSEVVKLCGPKSRLDFLRAISDDFADSAIPKIQRIPKALMEGYLRLMRVIGISNITEEELLSVVKASPKYNLDSLDTAGLATLAAAMRNSAGIRLNF